MKILTFDTSLNKTYITLGQDENITAAEVFSSSQEKYHSAFLIPELIKLLKTHNLTMKDIDAIGINQGPGSFTGIRICTVIARTAAQQLNIKVVPVPSLEILSKISDFDTLVLTDARKNKVYAAMYRADGSVVCDPYSLEIDDVPKLITSGNFEIITDNAIHALLSEKNIKSVNYEAGNYQLGKYLYQIVLKKLANDDDFHWAKVKPLYIQPPSITKSGKTIQ